MIFLNFLNFFNLLKTNFKRFFWYILAVVIVVFLVVAGYFYKNSIYYLGTGILATSESKALAQKVGELVFLPQDEVPTVAKVSNPELLKEQAFFIDAKVGDIVLIYTNSRKAVLYDPVANKIINMSTLNIAGLKKEADPQLDLTVKNKKIDSTKENQF